MWRQRPRKAVHCPRVAQQSRAGLGRESTSVGWSWPLHGNVYFSSGLPAVQQPACCFTLPSARVIGMCYHIRLGFLALVRPMRRVE